MRRNMLFFTEMYEMTGSFFLVALMFNAFVCRGQAEII